MTNYKLINPYVKGKMKNLFTGNTPEDAAQKTWSKLSSYINQNVPKFAFSLERINDKKKFHFVVREKIKKGIVDYSLEKLVISNSDSKFDKFKEKTLAFKKKEQILGGERKKLENDKNKDDDDDDSDSDLFDLDDDDDDDFDLDDEHNDMIMQLYEYKPSPIMYWFYNPVLYGVDYMFLPTFTAPLIPYVEIDLDLYVY